MKTNKMEKEKPRQSKAELIQAIVGVGKSERLSLSEARDIAYTKFFNNLRLLVAFETESAVDVSKKIGLESGTRLQTLCYGRGKPTLEEIMAISKYFKCPMDDLINKSIAIQWV
jgi:hypothetical protein